MIPKAWREWIYQADRQGTTRIRRTRYELCVLQRLREQLRSKEIWVEGADRYRNPETDLPADFAVQRERYYQALGLPQSADQFMGQLQSQSHQALQHFHEGLANNAQVKLLASGHIQVKRLTKQIEPATLIYLKQYIQQHWGMVSLIDVLKEVDLRVGPPSKHFPCSLGSHRVNQ